MSLYSYTSCFSFLFLLLFFSNDTPTTEIYTLSLHDASDLEEGARRMRFELLFIPLLAVSVQQGTREHHHCADLVGVPMRRRSEEHTSELQSPDHLVCRLLLEKKKKKRYQTPQRIRSTHCEQ